MKKYIFVLFLILSANIFAQNASYKRLSVDTIKSLNADKKIDLKDTLNFIGNLKIPLGAGVGKIAMSDVYGVMSWGNGSIYTDSFYVSYCSGCAMTTGWKLNGDTLKIDTCYVNTIIKDSLHALDTGKVSTSGDVMYGDLNVHADVYADTVHATVKQSVYLNSLASWDSQGVLNDTIIPKNVSDTLYNKILAIRPNKPDTSISNIDLIANTTLFPKGTYFHVYKGSYTVTVNIARDSCVQYFDAGAILTKTTSGSIFDFSDNSIYKNDINILGYGNFYKTTNTGKILEISSANTNAFNVNFEFNIISSTTDILIFISEPGDNKVVNIDGKKAYSSGSSCIYIAADGTTDFSKFWTIKINSIVSTAAHGIYAYTTKLKLESDYIFTSIVYPTAYGVYCYNGGMDYHVKYTNSLCVTMPNTSIYNYSSYKGFAAYIKTVGYYGTKAIGVINIDGCTNELDNTNAQVEINNAKYVLSDGDYSYTHVKSTQKDAWQQSMYFSASKGRILYDKFIVNYTYGPSSEITGGTVIIKDGIFENNGTTFPYFINLSSGTLICKGRWIRDDSYTGSSFVKLTGGTFVADGGVMIRNNSNQQFINAPNAVQNIKILSSGINCNGISGDFLNAKHQKNKIAITSLTQPTSFALNSTSITSTVNSSKAAIAADLVSKVNAAALGVTATQDNPGTDEYFYITADVAGTAFTVLYFTNGTNQNLILNSYQITDIVGGTIIEDTDVSY